MISEGSIVIMYTPPLLLPGTRKPSGTTIALKPNTSSGTTATLLGHEKLGVLSSTGLSELTEPDLTASVTFGTT